MKINLLRDKQTKSIRGFRINSFGLGGSPERIAHEGKDNHMIIYPLLTTFKFRIVFRAIFEPDGMNSFFHSHGCDMRTVLLKSGYTEIKSTDEQLHHSSFSFVHNGPNDFHKIVNLDNNKTVWTLGLDLKDTSALPSSFIIDGKPVSVAEVMGASYPSGKRGT